VRTQACTLSPAPSHTLGSDMAAADKLATQLTAAGVPHTIHRWEGVGHAFMNETPEGIERRSKLGQGEHNAAVVEAAWAALCEFFGTHLKA
jgi:carboxymethylenebutenolidase